MTDQPANATEARTTLDARIADKDWRDRVFNGDVAANKELRDLSAMSATSGDDVVEAVLKDTLPDIGQRTSEQREMLAAAQMFRELGIRDEVTSQFLRGEKVSPQEYALVKNWKTTAMGDQDFVKKYLSGDVKARQQMTLADSVLVVGAKGEAAAS